MSLSKQMRYVSVHKNLHTGRYSVVDRESGSPTYGKVTDSLDDLILVDCRFRHRDSQKWPGGWRRSICLR